MNQHRLELSQLEGVKIFKERRGGGKKPSTKDKEAFVHTLLETFSTRVLKLEKPRSVHFLYYYVCSIGGELEWVREAFLEGLVLNIGQPRLQRQPKLHSLLYLFSYLRASNSISGLILHTSLTYMLNFLTENYAKYLKRNSQVSVRKRSSEDIRKERLFRQAGTEITSPIGDDIFVFCYQSCLDLFTLKRSLLSREELDDLTAKFDQTVDKTLDFITFCIAESETFFILFRSLQDSLEDCQTRRVLEDLFSSCPHPNGGKFVSPRNRKEAATPVRRSAVLRDIDYLPFKPIQMKFYEYYISPHLALPGGCDSTPEPVHSPFDSGLSQVETNNTENCFRQSSPLTKRRARPWPDTGSLSPMNKFRS